MATSRTVQTSNDDVRLVGTLLFPGEATPHPAALLVPGSGPVDRNSDHARLPLGVTRLLAEALADVGIASLRFDKRGVGESGGDFLAAGLHDATADAAAMLDLLGNQPEVDPDRLLVIGHSEGAFHAVSLAAGHVPVDAAGAFDPGGTAHATGTVDGARLAGVALLGGAARRGDEVLRWQAGAIAPTLPAPARVLLRLLRVDLVKKNAKAVAKLRATTEDVERVGGRKQNARWFREFLEADPRDALARIDVPVLAVTGGKDVQTPPEDVVAIGAAVAGSFKGHVVDDVNHILRHEPGTPSPSHYKKQVNQPLADEVVHLVTDWAIRVTA